MIQTIDRINALERDLLIKKGRKDSLSAIIVEKEEILNKNHDLLQDFDLAIKFLTNMAQKARDETTKSIENLSTVITQTVYDDRLEIKLQYKDKTRTDSSDKLKLQIVKQTPSGPIVTGLVDEVGGGLVESVSNALRFACIKWLGYKGVVILDEDFKSLSNDEKLDRVATLLQELSISAGNQIIFSTHKQDIFGKIASKEFLVTQTNSISEVREC